MQRKTQENAFVSLKMVITAGKSNTEIFLIKSFELRFDFTVRKGAGMTLSYAVQNYTEYNRHETHYV